MNPKKRMALWAWVVLVCVACVVVLLIAIDQSGVSVRAAGIALGAWFPALITGLGVRIANRQPGNRIAWLLMGIGLAVLVEYFLQLSLVSEPVPPTTLDLVSVVLVHLALPTAVYLLFVIAFLFPTGRFLNRRHAWAAWPGAVMLIAAGLVALFTSEVGPPYPTEELAWTIINPLGFLPPEILDIVVNAALIVLILTAVGGVASLIVRYRRSTATTQAQIRWMVFSTSIFGAVLLLMPTTGVSRSAAGGLLLVIAFTTIPVCMTVAITRYRLFEIDRIISRTVSYAVIVVLLGALFAAGVVWLPTALGLEDSPLLVAATTLLVAASFNPLRKRIQEAVDRRFNRAHIEARHVEEQFAARVRRTDSAEQLANAWLETVDDAFSPQASSLWLRSDHLGETDS